MATAMDIGAQGAISTLIADSALSALFLDVDGTLLDIAPSPDLVVVDEPLLALLTALRTATDGALALISGRSIATLDRIFRPLKLDCAGVHGAELRHGGHYRRLMAGSPPLRDLVAHHLAPLTKRWPEILIEDKSVALALHFRLAQPDAALAIEHCVTDMLDQLGPAWRRQQGAKVIEIVPAAADKGMAIEHLMALPPFLGRQPVFAGDDLTDESGFAFVRARHGHGILVGPPRPTAARYALSSPTALRRWLWDVFCSSAPAVVVGDVPLV